MDEFTKISEYGQAESVMLGMQLAYFLNEYAKIARLAGENELASKWEREYANLKKAINETSWDGNWYLRAFSDRGGKLTPIGTHTEKEGSIYLNAQSWAVMSDVAPPDRADKCLQSVASMLVCDFGPKIFAPSYTSYNKFIGTQSIYAPGFRNGNIYMRPTGWAIIAACKAGKNELAWDMYTKASLAKRTKEIEVYQCEPYVYPENYVGPDHRMAGKGQFQWCLGEATSWMWVAYNYYLLGIRPEFDGLVIDPRMPGHWDQYSVERPFRGDHYSILVKKNTKLDPGELKIRLDGKSIKGNLIKPILDGKKHTIEVEIGPLT
jgi:cellobiose phosphorylase